MLTQDELKKYFNYNPETGLFIRILSTNRKAKVGTIAGYAQPNKYVRIAINKCDYYAHRLAWLYFYGENPALLVDHIDGNKSNNKISNLRLATIKQNSFNVSKKKNNKSGYKGVSFCKQNSSWAANIKLNGKHIHIGCFTTPELASSAYQEYAQKNHGDFYRDISRDTSAYI